MSQDHGWLNGATPITSVRKQALSGLCERSGATSQGEQRSRGALSYLRPRPQSDRPRLEPNHRAIVACKYGARYINGHRRMLRWHNTPNISGARCFRSASTSLSLVDFTHVRYHRRSGRNTGGRHNTQWRRNEPYQTMAGHMRAATVEKCWRQSRELQQLPRSPSPS